MKFDPKLVTSFVKCWLKLAPRDTFAITAATPITIPSTVRVERSFALLMLPSAIFPARNRGIINGTPFYSFYRDRLGER
jgi:hypothetical protein